MNLLKSTETDAEMEKDESVAKSFISEKRIKKIRGELKELFDDELFNLEDYAGQHISEVAFQRANRFIERVLDGDIDAAGSIFGCDWPGRYVGTGFADEGKPWAKLIHGNLNLTGTMALRKKLVEAHADLLTNERIKDLESIEDGLTQQVRKLEADLKECRSRIN